VVCSGAASLVAGSVRREPIPWLKNGESRDSSRCSY
jgi:hypothetical protein